MYLIIAVALIAGLFWVTYPKGRVRRRSGRSLRERYLRLLNMRPPHGEEALNRTLQNLQERLPNHSTDWYLRKMIADLERDRR